MVASTMAYSMSGSSETASNSRCQTSAFTQSRKRVKTLFQCPSEGGRSRQGLPVRTIHSTASTNRRLFLPLRPGSPGLPSARLAQTTRFHLRPLGVGQNEAFHPSLEITAEHEWKSRIPTGLSPAGAGLWQSANRATNAGWLRGDGDDQKGTGSDDWWVRYVRSGRLHHGPV